MLSGRNSFAQRCYHSPWEQRGVCFVTRGRGSLACHSTGRGLPRTKLGEVPEAIWRSLLSPFVFSVRKCRRRGKSFMVHSLMQSDVLRKRVAGRSRRDIFQETRCTETVAWNLY